MDNQTKKTTIKYVSQNDSKFPGNRQVTTPLVLNQKQVTSHNSLPDKQDVHSLILWASRILQEHDIDSPRLNAEVILSHLLGWKRLELYIYPDKTIDQEIIQKFTKAIQRRKQRVPLQYITNKSEFMSLVFYVDERVLIPRPETELLVEAVTTKLQGLSRQNEIVMVDIGAGSGNIAVTLAAKIPRVRIFAIDSSPDALEVAKMNAQRHQVLEKITFLCGDVFQPLEGRGIESKVDFIVSNPPYVASSEFETLQKEVRDFEPYDALISGKDGLEMFKRIIGQASIWLKQGGFIIMEVGEKQARKVGKFLKASVKTKRIAYIKDYQNISRIVVAQKEKNSG